MTDHITQLVDRDQANRADYTIAHAAEHAADVILAQGRPAFVEIRSDGTSYQLWVDLTQNADRGGADAGLLPDHRLLVALLNSRTAWHFGPNPHRNYVAEKLTGLPYFGTWDAEVITQFIDLTWRLIDQLSKDA